MFTQKIHEWKLNGIFHNTDYNDMYHRFGNARKQHETILNHHIRLMLRIGEDSHQIKSEMYTM